MSLFKKKNKEPKVVEVELSRMYKFMYTNFVLSSQHELLLLLERNGEEISCLKFRFVIYKYGYPNDEVGHPLMKYGLRFYNFYEVLNSTWVNEIISNNKFHPKHFDGMFADCKHYIAKFKDVTLEVIAREYSEVTVKGSDLEKFLKDEIKTLQLNVS